MFDTYCWTSIRGAYSWPNWDILKTGTNIFRCFSRFRIRKEFDVVVNWREGSIFVMKDHIAVMWPLDVWSSTDDRYRVGVLAGQTGKEVGQPIKALPIVGSGSSQRFPRIHKRCNVKWIVATIQNSRHTIRTLDSDVRRDTDHIVC